MLMTAAEEKTIQQSNTDTPSVAVKEDLHNNELLGMGMATGTHTSAAQIDDAFLDKGGNSPLDETEKRNLTNCTLHNHNYDSKDDEEETSKYLTYFSLFLLCD